MADRPPRDPPGALGEAPRQPVADRHRPALVEAAATRVAAEHRRRHQRNDGHRHQVGAGDRQHQGYRERAQDGLDEAAGEHHRQQHRDRGQGAAEDWQGDLGGSLGGQGADVAAALGEVAGGGLDHHHRVVHQHADRDDLPLPWRPLTLAHTAPPVSDHELTRRRLPRGGGWASRNRRPGWADLPAADECGRHERWMHRRAPAHDAERRKGSEGHGERTTGGGRCRLLRSGRRRGTPRGG